MVRAMALGRAGAAVAGLAKVVIHVGADALTAADRARGGRDVENAPVAERAAWRVGIVDGQGEAPDARRRLAPCQRRRLVRSVASVLHRDRLPVAEGAAGEVEFD